MKPQNTRNTQKFGLRQSHSVCSVCSVINFVRFGLVSLLGMMAAVVVSAAVTVATYNVENYTIADRMVEGVYRQAYPKPEKEKAALRHVISDIAPDILALCEMGKPEFLAEF